MCFRYYCDNDTTSESAMLTTKQCPAGKYCNGGLTDVSEATDCTVGKYCPAGNIIGGLINVALCYNHKHFSNLSVY